MKAQCYADSWVVEFGPELYCVLNASQATYFGGLYNVDFWRVYDSLDEMRAGGQLKYYGTDDYLQISFWCTHVNAVGPYYRFFCKVYFE